MQLQTLQQELIPENQISIPVSWERHVAQGVSHVSSPPVLGLSSSFLCAYTVSTPAAWVWAAVYILFAVLLPVIVLVWLVQRGKIEDLDVRVREQRIQPFASAIVGGAAAWVVLQLGSAPSLLISMAAASCSHLVLLLGITLYWKISVHCAVAGALAAISWILLGQALVPALGVSLVAWSRVCLNRQTLSQSVAGALLGATVFLLVSGAMQLG
jgi:membrane-associated phospholipid phosphatase